LHGFDKDGRQIGIEVFSRIEAKELEDFFAGAGRAVRASCGEGVIYVSKGQNPPPEGNFFALETFGISGSATIPRQSSRAWPSG